MKTIVSRSALLFLLLCFLPTAWADSSIKVGSLAPRLTLREILQAPDGAHGTWEELKGKAVVVEFWATWCGGCVDGIPYLNELAEKFRSKPLQFISITDETNVDLVRRFLARHPINGWIGFDAEAATFKRYGIEGRPQTLLVSPNGVVQAMTTPQSVTPQVLDDLLAGKPLSFPELRMGPLLGLEPNAPPPLIQVLIRPAAPVEVSGTSPGGEADNDGRHDGYGITLRHILSKVYDVPESRVDAPQWCSQVKYDFSVVTPQHQEALRWTLLRQAVESAFQMHAHKEVKETSVYILKRIDGQRPKLKAATAEGETGHSSLPKGQLEAMGRSISPVTSVANYLLGSEVLDETELTGRYDFNLKWDPKQPTSVIAAIREQLGLELVKGHRKREHLVVDSVEEPKTW